MPSTTPAALGAGLPVGAASLAPPAGLPDADQAFDDVFRQLTGGLLTTSAQIGEAMGGEEIDPLIDDPTGGADAAGESQPFGVVLPPAVFTLPVVVTPTPLEGSQTGVDGMGPDGAGTATRPPAAPQGSAGSGRPEPTAASTGAAPPDVETVPVEGAVDTEPEEKKGVLAAMILPADVAGAGAPATEVEGLVRGPDRRRGIRETPARARTFDSTVAETPAGTPAGIPVPAAAPPAPTTVVPNQITSEMPPAPASVASREMPAAAERAFALQRALARQSDNPHRQSAAPGLVAQVAPAGAETTPFSGGEAGAGDAPAGKRQGHAWTGVVGPGAQALPMTASTTAQTASAAGLSQAGGPQGEANVPGPAARAAWRAALASSALADAVTPAAEGTRPAGAPGLVAGLPPAVELAALRDRAPLVLDTPLAAAELDATTGESVHTQIVKSIRMQWTGGLGEARVTLKPEYLGEVTASIKVEQGVVTATLQADTPEVRRWMESHTATLRDALVEHGLKLDRLTIGEPEPHSAQGERQSRPRQKPQQQAPRPRARRDAPETDTPFEVTTE